MANRKSGELLRTVTPEATTSGGRCGVAVATRFSTSTWAALGSVPSLKVTVMLTWPSAVDCEDMYSMFSTPLICSSIGSATVSASTSAEAPGKVADTETVGGAISGYWATGRAG